MNKLEIGKNYGSIFGLKEHQQMIFNGGISWTAKETGKEMTKECQKTTDNVLAQINKTSVTMGGF